MSLICGSLFSGVGGFDLGLERAGHRVVWQAESDSRCRSVLRRHWPGVTIYEDVRDVGADAVPVDLICGGFPCQDLSVAGRRAGLDGARSGLWHEFRRIVSELLPTWVLVENVPGLRSSAGGRDIAVILRGLAGLGYLGAWRSVDAQHFSLAQRRERIFLLACRDPRAGSPAEVLAIAEGLSGHPAPGREAGTRVAASLTRGAESQGRGVAGAVPSKWRSEPENGNDTIVMGFNATQDQIHNPDRVGALSDQGAAVLAHTLRADGFGASKDGTIPRRLTPVECENLQGFPRDWTRYDDKGKEIADGPRYRMLGNAVAVPCAEWLGRRLAGGGSGLRAVEGGCTRFMRAVELV